MRTNAKPPMAALSRRALLATTAIAVAGAASGRLGTAEAATGEMVYRTAIIGEPKSLDPHSVSGTWENTVVGDLFMGLATDSADAKPVPGAAESWTISDDGLTYTFKLRDHAWSDGTPVTAEDFVYAWRRLLDPNRGAEYASIMYPVKNAQAINAGTNTDLASLGVSARDERTLEVTLEQPTGYFIELLTHYTAYPLPRHVVEKFGNEWIKPGNLVVNGPYLVTEWVPHSHLTALKNDKFYDAANVKIDKVIYYPLEDRNAALRRFRAGEVEFVAEFSSEQIGFLKENLPEETRIFPELGVYYYVFNEEREPFKDPRVRRALSMAIDREGITDKILKTGEIPAYGIVPPNTGDYGKGEVAAWSTTPYKERVAEAKKLLAEAGYGQGGKPLAFELSYNSSEDHKKIAVAVQAMWKALGVQANLVNREAKVHYDLLKQAQFDVARAAWIADYNDPQNFLYLLETRTGPNNYGRYSNANYDKLMADQAATVDVGKRMELMHGAEKQVLADDAWAPIFFYVSKVLVAKNLQGWAENPKKIHRARWMSIAS